LRIIGIDPGSLTTGIGIIEIKNNNAVLVEYDAISMSSKHPLTQRLKKIYDTCLKKIKKYKPDEFAIETVFYGKNIQSTLKLGQARGVAIIAAVNSGIPVSEYSPREVKKSVTGNGAASKEQVQFMIKSILAIKENPAFIDSSDALAISLCHFYSLQSKINKSYNRINNWKEFVDKNPGRVVK